MRFFRWPYGGPGDDRSIESRPDQPSQRLARGHFAHVPAVPQAGTVSPAAGGTAPGSTAARGLAARQVAAPVNGQTGAAPPGAPDATRQEPHEMPPIQATPPIPAAKGRPVSAPEHSGDSELVRHAVVALTHGDRSALHFLYVRYADEVRRYVRSIVRDEHEAEDITHTVFAKLITAIHRYEPRDVPFAAWVLRVARNAALDHLRARRYIPCEEIRTHDEGYEQVDRHRSQSLCEAFRRLPRDQREVLVLRHIAGLSPPEIARRIGKSESAVHGLHHRGRGALQAALREVDATPTVAG